MLTLNAAEFIAGVASVASKLTCTIFGDEIASGVETYKVLDQRQLASSVATIYTVPSSTQAIVLSIHVVNTDTVARTFQLFVNNTTAATAITPAITLQPGGMAVYTEFSGWQIFTNAEEAKYGTGSNLIGVQFFVTGGSKNNYIPSAGARAIYVEAVGGGGGGGGVLDAATNSAAGGGGGAGAYSAVFTTTLIPYLIAIGAGGAGGSAGANNGTAGGDTTFGSILTAKGGSGGISDTVTTLHIGGLGGAGGLASSGVGDIKQDGQSGGAGISLTASNACSGSGGNSRFGAGAQGAKTQSNGAAAVGYGGGGAGGLNLSSVASQAGGAGANGIILVWEFS